jgi:3-hydroxymyristoyl/3-hydroxydecanoyl-(acyl carrier protein) dehydratase
MGWIGPRGQVSFEPLPGVANRLSCRGQVIESTRKVTYEVAIRELGYGPEPYAIADALMYADGKPIVEITDMALRLVGATRAGLEELWAPVSQTRKALYAKDQILAFATGKPSDGFGDRYLPFDEGRFIARLPAPPYSFLDRIMSAQGKPWIMAVGTTAESQYDIPSDAWYFAADRQDRLPYAVLLEAALQACGWVAAYMGSALASDEPLKFRNLGGTGCQHAVVDRWSGTLTTSVKVTKITRSAGMIIQHYDFSVRAGDVLIYDGETYFGFFHPDALAEQAGIRDAPACELTTEEKSRGRSFVIPDRPPFPDRRWRMIENIEALDPEGGRNGLGLIEGTTTVDPEAWFFKAHFLHDPVWPGSLGLESFLQLLKVVAAERWELGHDAVFESPAVGSPHRWVYRGQILPSSRLVTARAEITNRDEERGRLMASGYLLVDGKAIYQMNDFTIGVNSRSARRTGTSETWRD